MWTRFCAFWRSLFRPAPLPATPSPQESTTLEVETTHQVLKDLHRKRDHLRQTIASYREFGYDDLARQAQEELQSVDRRILEVRLTHHAYS